jgi:hypothetical protein
MPAQPSSTDDIQWNRCEVGKVVCLFAAFAIVVASYGFSDSVALMPQFDRVQPLTLTANIGSVCQRQLDALDSCDTSGLDCAQANENVQACTAQATQVAELASAACRAELDTLQTCRAPGAKQCLPEQDAVTACASKASQQIAAQLAQQEAAG